MSAGAEGQADMQYLNVSNKTQKAADAACLQPVRSLKRLNGYAKLGARS